MEPITKIIGTAFTIRRSNIDTDQIIPANWMKRVERTGYEDGLFETWRKDKDFVLNDPRRSQSTIIVAGENFGCGSSRQHAVWALRDFGIRAVISTKIADIHRGNLPMEGIVPVELDPNTVDAIMTATEKDPDAQISIDLIKKSITCSAANVTSKKFQIDDTSRFNLLNGYDPIDVTLQFERQISSYERYRNEWLPKYTVKN